jgi:hypothetical protein
MINNANRHSKEKFTPAYIALAHGYVHDLHAREKVFGRDLQLKEILYSIIRTLKAMGILFTDLTIDDDFIEKIWHQGYVTDISCRSIAPITIFDNDPLTNIVNKMVHNTMRFYCSEPYQFTDKFAIAIYDLVFVLQKYEHKMGRTELNLRFRAIMFDLRDMFGDKDYLFTTETTDLGFNNSLTEIWTQAFPHKEITSDDHEELPSQKSSDDHEELPSQKFVEGLPNQCLIKVLSNQNSVEVLTNQKSSENHDQKSSEDPSSQTLRREILIEDLNVLISSGWTLKHDNDLEKIFEELHTLPFDMAYFGEEFRTFIDITTFLIKDVKVDSTATHLKQVRQDMSAIIAQLLKDAKVETKFKVGDVVFSGEDCPIYGSGIVVECIDHHCTVHFAHLRGGSYTGHQDEFRLDLNTTAKSVVDAFGKYYWTTYSSTLCKNMGFNT